MSAPAAWAYRPALDGMRAVAVTLVVVYHAGVPSASTVGACAYQAPDLVFPTERAYRSEAIRRPNVFSADYDRIACPHWPLCIPAIDGHLVFFNQYHLDDLWLRSHADDLWRLIIGSGALAP